MLRWPQLISLFPATSAFFSHRNCIWNISNWKHICRQFSAIFLDFYFLYNIQKCSWYFKILTTFPKKTPNTAMCNPRIMITALLMQGLPSVLNHHTINLQPSRYHVTHSISNQWRRVPLTPWYRVPVTYQEAAWGHSVHGGEDRYLNSSTTLNTCYPTQNVIVSKSFHNSHILYWVSILHITYPHHFNPYL